MNRRPGCGARIANILTAMIIFAALLAIIGFVVVLFVPDLLPNSQAAEVTPPPTEVPPTIAAVAVVPTVVPTATEDPLLPTFTPNATIDSVQPTATNTRRPTLTPSISPTFPPPTPTKTTARTTPHAHAHGSPSPTATFTRSPFPFTKSPDSPTYLRNFANDAGCDWLGIAGEVLDTNGNPVAGGQYRVHVWESGVDARVDTGSASSAYGPSGWEQFVFDAPVIRSYNLQLETVSGTAVSQVYQVQTRASCNENLVYFIFEQNR